MGEPTCGDSLSDENFLDIKASRVSSLGSVQGSTIPSGNSVGTSCGGMI